MNSLISLVRNRTLAICLASLVSAIVVSCSSTDEIVDYKDAQSVYEAAMVAYEDEDRLEAKRLFDVIILQFPASRYADKAQYFLGELSYQKGEYIFAAFSFNTVRNNYPDSEFARQAFFNVADCYYKLSPEHYRDQKYTREAIRIFSEFQAYYPNDSLSNIAETRIVELRNKLAEKDYEIAVLYVKMMSLRAALQYYNFVISDYPDTDYFEPAFVGRIRMQMELNMMEDARESIRIYNEQIGSDGELYGEVQSLASDLP